MDGTETPKFAAIAIEMDKKSSTEKIGRAQTKPCPAVKRTSFSDKVILPPNMAKSNNIKKCSAEELL